MKNLKFVLLVLLWAATAHAQPQRYEGLGVDRATLTAEQVATRTMRLQRRSDFYILRHEDAKNAPGRIFDPTIWSLIVKSARENNIDPMTLASIFYIESYGRTDAKASSSSAAGIAQITLPTAKDMRLTVKKEKIGSHIEKRPKFGWRGKGKNRKRVQVGTTSVRVNDYRYIDERLEPEKAIPATARLFASRVSIFGREDFAIQAHHDGLGRDLNLISAHTDIPRPIRIKGVGKLISKISGRLEVTEKTVGGIIASRNLTYADIFFRNTPYHNRATFKFLGTIPDFGATYYFNVEAARRLLNVYRESPAEYTKLYERYRSTFPNRPTLPNLMWSFYTPEQVQELRFADLEAMVAAKQQGRLVNLPAPWAKYGFYVRTGGKNPIAEKDLANQAEYIAAEPATIGCLLYIINELKLLQQDRYLLLELISAVRNDVTQGDLHSTNSNSRTDLPLHTMGKAIDLSRKNLKGWQNEDLLFVLYDLEIAGLLAFRPEGAQLTNHIVPNPEFEEFFTQFYREAIKQIATR